MRIYFYLLGMLFISCACKSGMETTAENDASNIGEETLLQDFNLDTLKGMYIGDFGGSDIRIVINFISQNHAVGYNIHKGLQRNISGNVIQDEKTVTIEMHEPGDNKFDGVFNLVFQKVDFSCKGTWKANDKIIGKKNFTLEKVVRIDGGLSYDSLKLEDINVSNFTSIFSFVSDEAGDFYFEDDGAVKYEYYPSKDTIERAEQMEVLNGSWSIKNGKVFVNWQKNNYFQEKKSIFDIILLGEYNFHLKYKERILYPTYF